MPFPLAIAICTVFVTSANSDRDIGGVLRSATTDAMCIGCVKHFIFGRERVMVGGITERERESQPIDHLAAP